MPVTPSDYTEHTTKVLKWTGETGNGVQGDVSRYPDVTIQATGTGTVTLQGSNDGTNWVALNDVAGVAISLAAASNAMATVRESPIFIRPVVAGGTATVTAICKATR